MLAELLSLNVYAFLLVFTRLGAALMMLPGFGEFSVSARVRLVFALALTIVILPLVIDRLPPLPEQTLTLFMLLGGEIFIGLAIGMMTRILVSALQVAGTIIAYHAGMGRPTATLFDPTQGQQGAMMGAFLSTLGVTLLFWGIQPSYAFVEQPQTNGVAERFNRTLKEQIIHGRIYRNIAELRNAVRGFVEQYNAQWIVEKNGYLSPAQARQAWHAAISLRPAA